LRYSQTYTKDTNAAALEPISAIISQYQPIISQYQPLISQLSANISNLSAIISRYQPFISQYQPIIRNSLEWRANMNDFGWAHARGGHVAAVQHGCALIFALAALTGDRGDASMMNCVHAW